MSDFIVSIKVRNGRLLRAIRSKYGTPSEMARKTGISAKQLSGYLTMRLSPVRKAGDWSKGAFDISSALAIEPEELWPWHIARLKLARNEVEIDMTVEDVAQITNGTEYMNAQRTLARWAAEIPDRKIKAAIMISGGATFDEVRSEVGSVTRERARQIALSGLRKFRQAAYRDGVNHVHEMKME